MKSDLRKNPLRSLGRYWLTMADSAAFTLVATVISVAADLRRELADQAGLPTRQGSADLAVVLLTAAEAGWGKGKAAQLVSQVVDLAGPAQALRGRVYLLVRNAVARLPLVLWSQDKHGARRELIEELTRQLNQFQAAMITHPAREEVREREWRETLEAARRHD